MKTLPRDDTEHVLGPTLRDATPMAQDEEMAAAERCAQILERIANEPPINGNALAQARVMMAVAQLRGA